MLKQSKKRSIFVDVTDCLDFYPKHQFLMTENEKTPRNRDGLPPFVKNWPQLYALMVGTLVALIIFFYLFMKHFQ